MKQNIANPLLGLLLAGCTFWCGPLLAQAPKNTPGKDTIALTSYLYQDSTSFQSTPYGKINRIASVAAIPAVPGSVLLKIPVANLTNTLYGQLQGLTVQQGSGQPGLDGASLSIRGIGSYDINNLTIYVDGFQTTATYLQYMSTSEIESISVLKDPAALASFGMKGANGVLLITTKRGTEGRSRVEVHLVQGVQQALSIDKPYGSYDYARLYNQAVSNDNYSLNGYQFQWTPKYSDAQLAAYQNGTGTNVDWYGQTLKKNGPYTNADILLSGGSTNAKYSLVLDYMKQGGLYNVATNDLTSNAQNQRFNIRSNLDFSFFKIFEAKVDLGGRIEDTRYPNIAGSTLWTALATYPSNIYPVKDTASGGWSGMSLFPNNPVASTRALGWYSYHDRTLLANFNLREKLDFITPGLYLNEAVSFNTWTLNTASKTATYSRYLNGVQTTTDKTTDIVSNGTSPVNQYDWKQANITAGYERKSGLHEFSALVNYFASNYVTDWNINTGVQNTVNNIFYHFENIGSRLHYAYKSRYILELTAGLSGSDNFAPGNRWGFYPALAAGWIVSDEPFLKNNDAVSFLKIRASAGKSGNDLSSNGRYLYQQYYTSNGTYYTGNNGLTSNGGIAQSYTANPNIFAESSMKYDAGLDLTFFNKLFLTADVFRDNRSGIVTQQNTLSGVYGGISPYLNNGKVTNKGIEVSTQFTDKTGAFTWSVGAWASYVRNRIDYQDEVPPVNSFSKSTGRAIGTPMGLQADGFYNLTDFNPDGTLKTGIATPAFGAVQPGDIKYKDLDGNGKTDQNDVTKIGNPAFPSLTYSLHATIGYKGIDLTVLFQGTGGSSVNLLTASYYQTVAFVNNINIYPIAGHAWAYYPDQGIDTRSSATYPRLSTQANNSNYLNSTFWIKKGDYLRLRNIELGYSLPSPALKRLHLEKLRIFLDAVNPFTWSYLSRHYKIDPETTSGYPGLKSFNGGISLTF